MAKNTTETLRKTLFDEMTGLIKGTSSNSRANAVARLANSIIESSRLEIDNARGGLSGNLIKPVCLTDK